MSEMLPPMPPQAEISETSAPANGVAVMAPPAPVAKTPKVVVPLGRPLTDLDAAWRLAMNMAQAKNVSQEIRGNAADIFLVFVWGAELQIGPAQALANISVFSGQPVLRGQLLLGLLRRSGHKLEELVSDDKQAIVRLTRADGQVWEASFTIEDALRAKLVRRADNGELVAFSAQGNKPKPWMLYTPDMLFWRAVGRVVRRGCSEVTLGAYIEGEIVADEEEPLANKAFTAMAEPTAEDVLAEVKAIENVATDVVTATLFEDEREEVR